MANGFRTGAKKLDSPSRQLPVAQMKAFVMALKKGLDKTDIFKK